MTEIWVDNQASGLNNGSSYVNAYTSISSSLSAVAGDMIFVLHTHTENFLVDTILDYVNATIANKIHLVSVDSAGAYIQSTINNFTTNSSGEDLELEGYCTSDGINYAPQGNLKIDREGWTISDSKISCGTLGLNRVIALTSTLSTSNGDWFKNITISPNHIGSILDMASVYPRFMLAGGSIDAPMSNFIELPAAARGGVVTINNFDLSNVTTNIFSGNLKDEIAITISRCKIASGVLLLSGTVENEFCSFIARSVDIGDGFHFFQEMYYRGDIIEETSIYRSLGSTYDGVNGFSAELLSNTRVDFFNPLKFELTNTYVVVTNYIADITFKVHLARNNGTLLKDTDFWIEIEHADGADNALGVLADTKPLPLAVGVNLTDETSGWAGLTGVEGTDHQVMSVSKTVNIGSLAGEIATGVVRVNVYLANPSDDIFVCGKVDIS